jgi:hypothetical protein
VQANTDYDAQPEIVIRLAGVSAIGVGDFIL